MLDQAEAANARGGYLGVLIDDVTLPFGFGGSTPVDIAPFRDGGRGQARQRSSRRCRRSWRPGRRRSRRCRRRRRRRSTAAAQKKIAALVAVLVVIVGAIGYFLFRAAQPTTGELIEAQLGQTPCAWLRVDPVRDGSNGTLGLTGVAGDPNAGGRRRARDRAGRQAARSTRSRPTRSRRSIRANARRSTSRGKLRKSPGGRLLVTGEPFILDTAIKPKPQALARVQMTLDPADKSMALFGVEPSGVVTWVLPDRASLEALKDADVGLTSTAQNKYEFSIYPDHLGWTGLFLVVGKQPLAATKPQGTVQSAREFAATLRPATAAGEWDADMVWFRIDPK